MHVCISLSLSISLSLYIYIYVSLSLSLYIYIYIYISFHVLEADAATLGVQVVTAEEELERLTQAIIIKLI